MVTKRGTETAVLVPIEQWRRLQAGAPLTLKELLLTDQARMDLVIPPRSRFRRREIEPLG